MNIVFLGIAIVQSALLVSASGHVLSAQGCLQYINEARSEYSTLYQVSNMNELVYDHQLEEDLTSRNFKCSEYGHAKSEETELAWNVNRQVETYRDMILYPGISRLACTYKFCEDGKHFINIMVDVSSEEPVKGTPGSNCPEDRKSNRKGLCSSHSMVASRKFIDFSLPSLDDMIEFITPSVNIKASNELLIKSVLESEGMQKLIEEQRKKTSS